MNKLYNAILNWKILIAIPIFFSATQKVNTQCPDEDALIHTYPIVATCSAETTADPVMVLANASTLTYNTSTYATSMTNDPNVVPPAGSVGEFSHANWTAGQIGTVYFTEFDDFGSVYMPASLFTKADFNGAGLQVTGAIGDAYALALADPDISGWDVIYQTNPITGAPSVWAHMDTNDGTADRAFGGITYDPKTQSFYVVNMGDYTIYQLNKAGSVLSNYTPTLGLSGSSDFQNRPFGLDINPVDGRLYYTVMDADFDLMVRSVGLAASGAMTGSDNSELKTPFLNTRSADGAVIISDIDFNSAGRMAVGAFTSERGFFFSNDDYSTLYNHNAEVYIFDGTSGSYTATSNTTVGQEDAPPDGRNATSTGGVAWNIDPNLPAEILWMSGGDFANEVSQWGVVGYNTSQFDNTGDQETATDYIQWLFAAFPDENDPKGNGGDVDIFYVKTEEIGGKAFLDEDNDGCDTEAGVEGLIASLFLCDASGDPVGAALASDTTDASGLYKFGPRETGGGEFCLDPYKTYTISFSFPADGSLIGYSYSDGDPSTNGCANANNADDSPDDDGTTSCYDPRNPSSGDDGDEHIDVGLFESSPLSNLFESFKIENSECEILAQWKMNSNQNIDAFEVQLSENGVNFNTIQKLELQEYSFTNFTQKSFIRIKANLTDGTSRYSSIEFITANCDLERRYSIYPNPSINQEININIGSFEDDAYNIQLIDKLGKVVYETTWNTSSGENYKTLSLLNIPPGMYILNLNSSKLKHFKEKIIIME